MPFANCRFFIAHHCGEPGRGVTLRLDAGVSCVRFIALALDRELLEDGTKRGLCHGANAFRFFTTGLPLGSAWVISHRCIGL